MEDCRKETKIEVIYNTQYLKIFPSSFFFMFFKHSLFIHEFINLSVLLYTFKNTCTISQVLYHVIKNNS